MKISVIVPVYNVEAYLEECLNSIIMQNFQDFEIICVNDKSTDDSYKILEKFKNENIKIINNEVNGGLSYSRNRGLELAKGDYVLFVDSDDYLEKCTLEILYNSAQNLKTDILYYDKKIFYENNFNGSKDYVPDEVLEYTKIYTGLELFIECSKINVFNSVNAYTQFFKRDFLKNNNLVFYNGIIHEDLLFYFLCAMKAERVSKIKEKLYVYRKRNGSITAQISEARKQSIFIVFTEILNYWKNNIFTSEENEAIQTYIEMVYRGLINYQDVVGNDSQLSFGNSADRFLYKIFMNKTIIRKYIYTSFTDTEIKKIKCSKSIWIYGAGNVGSEVALFLEEKKKNFNGFVVSDINLNSRQKFGWTVNSINSILAKQDDLFIVAVTKKFQSEIISILRKKGFKNFIFAVK